MKKAKVLKYTAVFEQDKGEGGYTATIPSLPGCISEGETFEEALENIREAAELYLEDLKDNRVPQTKPLFAPIFARE